MSSYFSGPKPGKSLLGPSGFAAVKPTKTNPSKPAAQRSGPPAPGKTTPGPFPEPKTAPTEPTTRTVKVRAHTRTIPAKPSVNTQTVRPAQVSTVQRFAPNFPGEVPAGFTHGIKNPDGTWDIPGGSRPQPGAIIAERPFYTDAFTRQHNAGPTGQEGTQWNAAQVAAAKRIQQANYGTPGYILRSVLPGGLDEGGIKGPGEALSRGASIASLISPTGGVGEAAGILGFGLKALRGGRAVKDVGAAEEAATAGKDVARVVPPETPKRGTVAPFAPEEAAVVRGAMPGAKVIRGKQEAGYSLERSKRAAAARVHLEDQTLTPAERVGKAKGELVGELPKIDFQGFHELNDESLHALQTHILDHPHLLPFQKIRASDALVNALAGKVPTRSEIILLEHVFGKNTAAGLNALARNPVRDRLLSVLNIPRSLMASFDLSAPFRQGLMVSTRHPTIFTRNLGSMVKAFGSEKVYHAMIDEIRSRPTYPLMLEARLPLTELGADVGAREEQFASDYAEKLTGGKYGPVRASGRAYTGFLDKTRADVFDHLIATAHAQGIDVQDPKFLKSLGRYIGSATGRGDLGSFQEAGKVLNAVLFSPRLLASRLNFLNPLYYARLDPFARKEALRSALQLAGTLSTLLALASRVPGVKVATDPRNPDWGKIRVGNTRIDIAGGFQQELRLLAQLATGVAISSTTGKKLSLTAGGFGQPTRLDILLRFFEGKESPLASLATDKLRGSNQIGQKFSWKSELVQRMTPLLAQDSYDLYNERHGGVNGITAAFAGYGLGSFGFGLQTYNPTPPKGASAPADYFGGSGSSGGSPYFSSPSSGSGGGYFGQP